MALLYRLALRTALFAAVPAGLLPAARAQELTTVEASPHAHVAQTIGLSEVSVDYHRPAVRGRTVWGGLVPYNEVWRAGANENTVFETSTPIEVEGRTLPAGRYGFHTIPTAGAWTVIFSTFADAWGSFFYDQAEDALRVTVRPRAADHAERLLYRFDDVTDTSAVFVLHWAEVEVPIRLSVNTPGVVLASMERELRSLPGFTWQAWDQAAAYALQHRLRLDDALGWADRSVQRRRGFGNVMTRAAILDALTRRDEAMVARAEALAMDAPEAEVNAAGYRLLGAGASDYALVTFEKNVAAHPDSWNAHDSLAEALETMGDRRRAAEHYEHARAMAPAGQHARLDAALARVRRGR